MPLGYYIAFSDISQVLIINSREEIQEVWFGKNCLYGVSSWRKNLDSAAIIPCD